MTTSSKQPPKLILASASPRRREVLSGLGLDIIIDPSAVPEPEPKPGESPRAYAIRAARLKVREVAQRHRQGIVIGADTIVVVRERILGKPASPDEAGRMLGRLQGGWHEVVTGLCLCDARTGTSRYTAASSMVRFRRMSRAEIRWYISTGEWDDKAGGYAVQGHASLFIDRIEGCYFNIVGFPVSTFADLCRRIGLDVTAMAARR